jgi:hypothetical protein
MLEALWGRLGSCDAACCEYGGSPKWETSSLVAGEDLKCWKALRGRTPLALKTEDREGREKWTRSRDTGGDARTSDSE